MSNPTVVLCCVGAGVLTISARHLNYHQFILKRNYSELIKRIYQEQKINPTDGDFVKLISEDFKLIDEVQNDEKIKKTVLYQNIKHT